MDYQNAEFYKLNKNTPDLVYNFANETITYKKEEIDGVLTVVEYRRKEGKKGTVRRVVSSHEMSVADFDEWKTRLAKESLEYRRHDDLTTRQNVSIENLLNTDLVAIESVEDEYIRAEDEKQALPKTMDVANELLTILTPTQRSRYIKAKKYGKTTREIAADEGCAHQQITKSIAQAQAKINKERAKRGY